MTCEEAALYVARTLFARQGEDVQVIQVGDRTIIADYMVIATGNTNTMVRALCEDLQEKMEAMGCRHQRIEGLQEGRWIVLDYGDILVHLFHREEREFYRLERLWSDGTNIMTYQEE